MVISGERPVSKRTCQRSDPAAVSRQRTMTIDAVNSLIDGQKIGVGILFDPATSPLNSGDRICNDVGMHSPQGAIDLDVAVVAVGREPDQLIGAQQDCRTGFGRRCSTADIRFVDDQSGKIAALPEAGLAGLQHLLVGEPIRPLPDDRLSGIEQEPVDDRLEDAVGTDPHVWTVPNPLLLELERDAVPDIVAEYFSLIRT